MKVIIYGLGYLGQSYAQWLSGLGHTVFKIEDWYPCVSFEKHPDLVWVTFDTPIDTVGTADVQFIKDRIREIPSEIPDTTPIIISSQIPVGTIAQLEAEMPNRRFMYIPENVRVGRALEYLMNLDRIILGTRRQEDFIVVDLLINGEKSLRVPILVMSPESAEMVKHTINAFLATCISFANEMGLICAKVGAIPQDVTEGIRTEWRIGKNLPLAPGKPFSTGHLERDLVFLQSIASLAGIPIPVLEGVTITNRNMKSL